MAPSIRCATHAGSWYQSNSNVLSRELDGWLADVLPSVTPIGKASSQEGAVEIPVSGARAIIAPHAGYSYSGPAAAWAYKSADWANAKRVFLLGPSHHQYFTSARVTDCDEYQTPLGNLTIDKATTAQIRKEWDLSAMDRGMDEDEHSLEMHLPYIYKMLSIRNTGFQSDPTSVPLIPLLIGATTPSKEKELGRALSPYLADPTNLFVISSDFCHWGTRFRYTYYRAPSGSSTQLRSNTKASETRDYAIHESIKSVDYDSMDAVETGNHDAFLQQLEETGNTVCGRHPIGVFMAAVQAAELGGKGRFKFVRYERSSEVVAVAESSVSYCSAFAVL
ncbi:UPF0103-domain-containing protein [Massarina eburnea CBS 473.64]|uniref:UPF0103-domain-containing protein n=1 Tax=Massarina eburnea CBS 473.64 TaxID=1395130 RepID=A0A6A6S2B0_9PLEO|nr:UPF0103-domain-containing protein [Massarina eburnea CBS 473.64]